MNLGIKSLITRRVLSLTQSKKPLGSSGFTLIEAMIIAAMISVIIVTFSSFTFQRARQIQMFNDRKNAVTMQNSIKSAAAQSESITRTEELGFQILPTPTP